MNAKVITIAAGVGFVLSFLIGLVSHVAFSSLILRAFVFALIFAAAAAGISIVFQKFLDVSTSASGESESSSVSVSQSTPSSGGVVNITIEDDVLPDEDTAPKFSVSKNRPSFGGGELSKNNDSPSATESSVPISQIINSDGDSQNSQDSNEEAEKSESSATAKTSFKPMSLGSPVKSSSSGVDTLPEIGDLNVGQAKSDEEDISDSDFASKTVMDIPTTSAAKKEITLDQNASVMAQAIRTALSQDDE